MLTQFKRFSIFAVLLLLVVSLVACDLLSGTNSSQQSTNSTKTEQNDESHKTTDPEDTSSVPEDLPEIHQRKDIYIELISNEYFYADNFDGKTAAGMTLGQFAVEVLDAPSFEETLKDGAWYVNYESADANTVLQGGMHLIYIENNATDKLPTVKYGDGITDAVLSIGDAQNNASRERVQVKGEDISLEAFVDSLARKDLFENSYEKSLLTGYWCINGERADGNVRVEDGNTVSYHEKEAEDEEYLTTFNPNDSYENSEDVGGRPSDPSNESTNGKPDVDYGDIPGVDDDGDGIIDNEGSVKPEVSIPPEVSLKPEVSVMPEIPTEPGIQETDSLPSDPPEQNPDEDMIAVSFIYVKDDGSIENTIVDYVKNEMALVDFVDGVLREQGLFAMSFRESVRADGRWMVDNADADMRTKLYHGSIVVYISAKNEEGEIDPPHGGEDTTDREDIWEDSIVTGLPGVDTTWPEDTTWPGVDTTWNDEEPSWPEDTTWPGVDTTWNDEEPSWPEDTTWPGVDTTWNEGESSWPEEETTWTEDTSWPGDVETGFPGDEWGSDTESESDVTDEPLPAEMILVSVYIEWNDGNIIREEFEVPEGILLCHFVGGYLYNYIEMSFEESLERGEWAVNGSVGGYDTVLTARMRKVTYKLNVQDDGEHEHVWNDEFTCDGCGAACTHDFMTDSTCPDCGFTMGGGELVVNMNFAVYVDEAFASHGMYTTVLGYSMTLREVFDCVVTDLGSWNEIEQWYDVYVDGACVDGSFEMSSDVSNWTIYLVSRVIDEPDVFEPFYVEGMWYLESYDGGFDSKRLTSYVDYEMSLRDLIDCLYLDVSDYSMLNFYVNNVIVDIDNFTLDDSLAIDEVMYLVIAPKTMRPSFQITVHDKIENARSTFSFDHPVYWQVIEAKLLEGRDTDWIDVHFNDFFYETISLEPFYDDVEVEIDWHESVYYVEYVCADSVEKREISNVGEPMILREFVQYHFNITDFDAYYFFDIDAGYASQIYPESKSYRRVMILPKSLVPEQIKVEYSVALLDEEGMTHTGEFFIDSPMKLHEAFDMQYDLDFMFPSVFDALGYEFYINGELLDNADGKMTYYVFIYDHVEVVVKPVVAVNVLIEEPCTETLLKFENMNVTFAEIAEMLGVSFDIYMWYFDGYLIVEPNMPIESYCWGGGMSELRLVPKYLVFSVDIFGVIDYSLGWFYTDRMMGEVTLAQLLEVIADRGYDVNGYSIVMLDNYGNEIELTAEEGYTFTFPAGYWDNNEYCYSIRFYEPACKITIRGFDYTQDISFCEGEYKKNGTVKEILDWFCVDMDNIKHMTFFNANGEGIEVALDSVISEDGFLEVEYFAFYEVYVSMELSGRYPQDIFFTEENLTFAALAEKYGFDFVNYAWMSNGEFIFDPDAQIFDYADNDSRCVDIHIVELQMEIYVDIIASEIDMEDYSVCLNSEKEPNMQRTISYIAEHCGIKFDDYSWYLFDENGDMVGEITSEDYVLEFALSTDDSRVDYTYYSLILLPKTYVVTVEVYVNEEPDVTKEVTMHGFVGIEAVLEEIGYSMDRVYHGFVHYEYREGTDVAYDTVIVGPCRLYLYVYENTEY